MTDISKMTLLTPTSFQRTRAPRDPGTAPLPTTLQRGGPRDPGTAPGRDGPQPRDPGMLVSSSSSSSSFFSSSPAPASALFPLPHTHTSSPTCLFPSKLADAALPTCRHLANSPPRSPKVSASLHPLRPPPLNIVSSRRPAQHKGVVGVDTAETVIPSIRTAVPATAVVQSFTSTPCPRRQPDSTSCHSFHSFHFTTRRKHPRCCTARRLARVPFIEQKLEEKKAIISPQGPRC